MKNFLKQFFCGWLALIFIFVGVVVAKNSGAESPASIQSDASSAEQLSAEVGRLCSLKQFSEALPLARKVVEIRENTVGKKHLSYGSALANVGNILFALKQYAASIESLTAALEVLEMNSANFQPGVFRTWMNRGSASFELKDYKLAKNSFDGAINCVKGPTETEKVKLGEAYSALGRTYFAMDSLYRAGECFAKKYLLIDPDKRSTTPIEYLEMPAMKLVMANSPKEGRFPFYKFARMVTLPDGTEKFEFEIRESDFVPASSVSRILPNEISRTAKDHRIRTNVAVLLTVDTSGKVENTAYLAGGGLFQTQSIEAGNRWRFKPALYKGSPVKQTFLVIFTYGYQS